MTNDMLNFQACFKVLITVNIGSSLIIPLPCQRKKDISSIVYLLPFNFVLVISCCNDKPGRKSKRRRTCSSEFLWHVSSSQLLHYGGSSHSGWLGSREHGPHLELVITNSDSPRDPLLSVKTNALHAPLLSNTDRS